MVAKTQHYIHNPQAFIENSARKSARNQALGQFIGNSVANLASISIYLCKQKGDDTTTTNTPTPTTITTTTTTTTTKGEPEVVESDDDIKKNIIEYLKGTGITPDETTMEAIIKKYKNIKSFAIENKQELTEARLKERIILFAQGLEFRKATLVQPLRLQEYKKISI